MASDVRQQYIKGCEEAYKKLLGLESFPEYNIKYKTITMEKSKQQGFDSFATAYYDIPSRKHLLEIWENLYTLGDAGTHVVFHELTHVWDDELYVQGDKIKYLSNHGFTEYHASQIEMMKLLGADTVSQEITFSMVDAIDTVSGRKIIQEYVTAPHALATELISREDFPVDFETLKCTLGVIFNYYGRRSICKMYANDYREEVDNSAIEKLITPTVVTFLNGYMTGWLNQASIDVLGDLYGRMVVSLANKFHLR